MTIARCGGMLCIVLATTGLVAAPPASTHRIIEPRGPGEFPERLHGDWKVSLCCRPFHAWIRFENIETGEVHTIARFRRKSGDAADPIDGTSLPTIDRNGLWWDQDLRHEASVRAGLCVLVSVIHHDPAIYMGRDGGTGYSLVCNNCTHYAVEAWHFYSGEKYSVGPCGLPAKLAGRVARRYPGLAVPEVLGPK